MGSCCVYNKQKHIASQLCGGSISVLQDEAMGRNVGRGLIRRDGNGKQGTCLVYDCINELNQKNTCINICKKHL